MLFWIINLARGKFLETRMASPGLSSCGVSASLTHWKTDAPAGSDAKDAAPSRSLRTSRRPHATMSRALGFSYVPGYLVQLSCLENLTLQARAEET